MTFLFRLHIILAALAMQTTSAQVLEFNIATVEPFAEGATFGNAGAYERVRGTFKGELDPNDARNKVIVNLDKAPRNAAGRVEYEADFFMLRPVEAARGNGKLIYDVTNRGRKYIHWRLMDARPATPAQANDPRTLEDAGNGLLFRMGYTFVWSGWDPDAPRSNNGMTMKPVIATNNGKPIVKVIRDELVNGTRSPLRETFRLTHNAATTDQSQAKLTVRRREADARKEISATGWAYVNDREIRLLPEGTKPEPGSIYEFHYPAKDPRVLGIGMAATRDLISFMRYESADAKGNENPARSIKGTLAFGISQSGRFLRDFVYQGFNQDTRARKVLDSYDVLGGPHTFNAVWATTKFATQNPVILRAFADALADCMKFITKDPRAATEIWIKAEKSKLSVEDAEKLIRLPENEWTMTPKKVTVYADFMHRTGVLSAKPVDWKEIFFDVIHDLPGS